MKVTPIITGLLSVLVLIWAFSEVNWTASLSFEADDIYRTYYFNLEPAPIFYPPLPPTPKQARDTYPDLVKYFPNEQEMPRITVSVEVVSLLIKLILAFLPVLVLHVVLTLLFSGKLLSKGVLFALSMIGSIVLVSLFIFLVAVVLGAIIGVIYASFGIDFQGNPTEFADIPRFVAFGIVMVVYFWYIIVILGALLGVIVGVGAMFVPSKSQK